MLRDLSVPFESTCIKGTLHSTHKSDIIVLICHGYTDSKDTPGIQTLSELISQKYDVFRFTFTDAVPHLPTQSNNIRTLVHVFKKTYTKVIVLGHSLGGLSAILSTVDEKEIDGIILINPLVDIKKHIAWKYKKILILGILAYPFIRRMRDNIHYYVKTLKPSRIVAPALIIVSKHDQILDPNHGVAFYNSIGSVNKKLIVNEHMTHGLDTNENLNHISRLILSWLTKI